MVSFGEVPHGARAVEFPIRPQEYDMGFASFLEDVLLRAAENGFDIGAASPPVSSMTDGSRSADSKDAVPTTRRRRKTVHLKGEEARRFILIHLGGAKEIAYLRIIQNRTGRVVQEFPYRERAEVEGCLSRVEATHPGAFRLVIVKRLEIPEARTQAAPGTLG